MTHSVACGPPARIEFSDFTSTPMNNVAAVPRMRFVAMLLCMSALAGCSAKPTATDLEPATASPEVDPWGGAQRMLILDRHSSTTEADLPLCLGGGSGFDLQRTGNQILNGTRHLEVTVSAAPGQTGVQAGYSIDGSEHVWLPTVTNGIETFIVPVSQETFEPEARWRFRHQMNLPDPATQPCYTGGGSGQWDIVVQAVKA